LTYTSSVHLPTWRRRRRRRRRRREEMRRRRERGMRLPFMRLMAASSLIMVAYVGLEIADVVMMGWKG